VPRLARVVCAGSPHHVTQRGNRRVQVFFSDWDRREYLNLLGVYARRHGLAVLAYCLMPNHVHLIVVPQDEKTLQRVMKPLHMRHAQRLNRNSGGSGIVWQGRYFSSVLDEAYLWNAIRYVERNPVRARMEDRAETYPWSSAAAHCGLRADTLLTTSVDWARYLAAISDWSAWLAAGDEQAAMVVIRRNTGKGLPCGSPAFVEALEVSSGRSLTHRPQGRPPRSTRVEKG